MVATRGPSVSDGHANIPDVQNVCLDFGSLCEVAAAPPGETARCPVFGAPVLAMGVARARAGMTPEPKVDTTVRCLAWGRDRPHEFVGMTHLICSVCTGAICPLFDVPTGEMKARLMEAGLV